MCYNKSMKKKKNGNYGFVEFVDKGKLNHDGYDADIEPELRKPTPAEREEIILNLVRANSGRAIRIPVLASLLGVSNRTIQMLFRKLEKENKITRKAKFTKTGKQLANVYIYNGTDTELPPTALTLEKLYDADNPCGFRDWDWECFKFIPGYYDDNFTKADFYAQANELYELKEKQQKKKDKFYTKKDD